MVTHRDDKLSLGDKLVQTVLKLRALLTLSCLISVPEAGEVLEAGKARKAEAST